MQDPIDDKITSGSHHSYWNDSAEPLRYEPLRTDLTTDVLVIGGGIAGLTAAYCIAKSGLQVVLVEDGCLGSGESGRTTAQITYALDDRYYDLEKFFGKENAALAAESHKKALEWIRETVNSENIDCHFMDVDGYLFCHPTDAESNLDKELEATQRVGLPTEMTDKVPGLPSGLKRRALRFPDQGQFHIMKYLRGLAEAIVRMGGEIYTDTHADAISGKGAKANGHTITASHIVVATNTPVNDLVTMHTKQHAYRSYVIAAKVPKGVLPYAMWWDTGNMESKWVAKPYHYVRLEPLDDNHDLLISGGEDHKTGQADEEHISEAQRYENLTRWSREHFPYFSEVSYRWSGQVMEPVDSLAYIGKNPGDNNIFIITGDSGNGMTHGTLGGLIINDLITGKANPYSELYDPARITLRTGVDYLKEVGNMGYKMIKDWVTSGDVDAISQLPAGKGAILSKGLEKIAVYRDGEGTVHSCSAVCPHLGGVLQWNDDEKSFDCPLHGSRFTAYGSVINGPANCDLNKIV
ncbi:FAD-dependent oxidoreductase [Flavobacterium sp. MFBS3-15]|uniref:FAD-dependent oxidoreductase n=1 Tax=Flavobacterium sp. MFBS3-15 TaxID=2989816 RepID=UPI0022354595|nr:FAD-dependent oxidoreductase [Flavobacterium sp. MFBS3-15]MCW4467647.1 FAD-dependent oxidoreductase [Flavobacterium sp. MFBS3-15]